MTQPLCSGGCGRPVTDHGKWCSSCWIENPLNLELDPKPVPLDQMKDVAMAWSGPIEDPKPETAEERTARYAKLSDRRPWFEWCRCGLNKHGRLSPLKKAIQADFSRDNLLTSAAQRLAETIDKWTLESVYADLKARRENHD